MAALLAYWLYVSRPPHDKRVKMGQLNWCDDYSVHISAIDNEHKFLIELIKELDSAMETEEMVRLQLVSTILEKLLHHIRVHFESEERFLLFNNYPDFDSHQQQHQLLLQKLETFISRLNSEHLVFTDQMLLFIKDWYARHILLDDSKFGRYFLGKELAAPYS